MSRNKKIVCKCCDKKIEGGYKTYGLFCNPECYVIYYKIKSFTEKSKDSVLRMRKSTGKEVDRSGFLYMFNCKNTKRVKIGFMKDVERIKAYNTHLPIRIDPVICNGSMADERSFIWTAKEFIIEKIKKESPNKPPMAVYKEFDGLVNGEWIDYKKNPEILKMAEKFMTDLKFRKSISKKVWSN